MTEEIKFDKFVLFDKFNIRRLTIDNLTYVNINNFLFAVNQNNPKLQPFTPKLKNMLLSKSRLNEHGEVDIFVPAEFIDSYNRKYSIDYKRYVLINNETIDKYKVSSAFKGVYIPTCVIKPACRWLNVM